MAKLVHSVSQALAFKVPLPISDRLFVAALGQVKTTGWTGARLSPRFEQNAPTNGIWILDFVADPPVGPILPANLPIAASVWLPAPNWATSVVVKAETNEVAANLTQSTAQEAPLAGIQATATGNIIWTNTIAIFDDSFQPIGFCGFGKIKMKKLRHELTLTVEGPDEAKIRKCFEQSLGAGLIAAIIIAYTTGGAGLPAAISAFLSSFSSCLGSSYVPRFDDRSHWIEWCT